MENYAGHVGTWVPVLPSDDQVTFGKVSAHHRTDRPKFAHHVWAKIAEIHVICPWQLDQDSVHQQYHFHERIIT